MVHGPGTAQDHGPWAIDVCRFTVNPMVHGPWSEGLGGSAPWTIDPIDVKEFVWPAVQGPRGLAA